MFMTNVQISLDEDWVTQLDRMADEQRKTRTAVIREAIGAVVCRQSAASFERQWIAAAQADQSEEGLDDWMSAESWESDESW